MEPFVLGPIGHGRGRGAALGSPQHSSISTLLGVPLNVKRTTLGAIAALAIAMAWTAAASPRPVAAAFSAAPSQCPAGQNTRICNGTVSPSSGTTVTNFTFSVEYQDTLNRKPYTVQLIVDGNAPINIAPTSGQPDVTNGEIFTYTTTLPQGSHTYWYKGFHGATVRCDPGGTVCPPSACATT